MMPSCGEVKAFGPGEALSVRINAFVVFKMNLITIDSVHWVRLHARTFMWSFSFNSRKKKKWDRLSQWINWDSSRLNDLLRVPGEVLIQTGVFLGWKLQVCPLTLGLTHRENQDPGCSVCQLPSAQWVRAPGRAPYLTEAQWPSWVPLFTAVSMDVNSWWNTIVGTVVIYGEAKSWSTITFGTVSLCH